MTTDGPRRDTGRSNGLAVGLVTALAVAVAISGVTTVAIAQSGGASGETALEVTLPESPDGLAGYQLTLELAAGTVTGATYPDAYQPTTEPAIADDGRSVALEAADVSNAIQAGDGEVVLATVAVADPAGERPPARVTDAEVDADGGDQIDPASVAISVEGSDGPGDGGGEDSPAGGGSGGDEPAEADGPGFGVLVAVGVLLGVGTFLWRR